MVVAERLEEERRGPRAQWGRGERTPALDWT